MLNFLFGFLGALAAAALVSAGVALGWKLRKEYEKRMKPEIEPPTERERRLMIEQQEAFRRLQNYTAETAYGIGQDDTLREDRPFGGDGG